MRIRKYDFDYSRRCFMEKVATGAGAGVLAPLWSTIANSADNISKAYPDELLSIEMYTKGKIKPGDVITENNVEAVKDLLDPLCYAQIKNNGRRINIVESTKDAQAVELRLEEPIRVVERGVHERGQHRPGDGRQLSGMSASFPS